MGGQGSGNAEDFKGAVGARGNRTGKINRVSAKLFKEAAATGEMPAPGLMRIFRYWMAEADRLMRLKVPDDETEDQALARYERIEKVLEYARVAGKDAAPYYHARLSAHKVQGEISLAHVDIRSISDDQLFALLERFGGLFAGMAGGPESEGGALIDHRPDQDGAGEPEVEDAE